MELKRTFLQLPRPDEQVGMWCKIPLIFPPFMFKRRLVQQILFGGTELKSGAIEEYSLHVLVEALFLTVSCQPLFTDVFIDKHFSILHSIFVSFFYFTVVVQVSSLIINIIWICSMAQLQER